MLLPVFVSEGGLSSLSGARFPQLLLRGDATELCLYLSQQKRQLIFEFAGLEKRHPSRPSQWDEIQLGERQLEIGNKTRRYQNPGPQ